MSWLCDVCRFSVLKGGFVSLFFYLSEHGTVQFVRVHLESNLRTSGQGVGNAARTGRYRGDKEVFLLMPPFLSSLAPLSLSLFRLFYPLFPLPIETRHRVCLSIFDLCVALPFRLSLVPRVWVDLFVPFPVLSFSCVCPCGE